MGQRLAALALVGFLLSAGAPAYAAERHTATGDAPSSGEWSKLLEDTFGNKLVSKQLWFQLLKSADKPLDAVL
ncbi:hypothetical protein [Streptomyces sp. NPDC017941]|uniref:hypothetical protein n=1 Tax=Streptomyces sp. NPDC017941 TaxID=3365018 RepID=UPI00378A3B72